MPNTDPKPVKMILIPVEQFQTLDDGRLLWDGRIEITPTKSVLYPKATAF